MAFLIEPPTIAMDQLRWDETGDEDDLKARLVAHIRIGDVDMHLEAWATDPTAEFQSVTESSWRADDFDQLCAMMDTTFQTTEINGREYVLLATPYGA